MSTRRLALFALVAALGLPAHAQDVCKEDIVATFLSRDSKKQKAPLPFRFEVKVQGKSALIKRIVPSYLPRRVVIVFDLSGSMEDKIPAANILALGILPLLPADTRIGFLTFADKVANVIAIGDRRNEIQNLLQRIGRGDARGRTAAMDGVTTAINMLEPTQPGDLIYVITDGGDNRSRIRQSALEKLVLAKKVRLLTALFWDFLGRTPEEANGPSLFDEMGERSGGIMIQTSPLKGDLISALGKLQQYVNWSYLIELESPSSQHSQKIELSALDERGKKLDKFLLEYPHYTQCAVVGAAAAR